MNKLSFLGVAGLAWIVAAPASAADLPMAVKSPAPFATRFTWTGCYGGGHVGAALERLHKKAAHQVEYGPANQDSSTLLVFRIDASTGRLTPLGPTVDAPSPTCVLFERAE